MAFWLWSLYFLSVSGTRRILPEVKLEGVLGGSITIECPLPEMSKRVYLCRKMTKSGVCTTVVSNQNFIKEKYKRRVILTPWPSRNLFLVEVTDLAISDSGVYACGVGMNTDRSKTQQVTLNVHSAPPDRDSVYPENISTKRAEPIPFLEEEPTEQFHGFQHMPVAPWFPAPTHASSEFTSKVPIPAQRTKATPALYLSPIITTTQHARVSRASSRAGAKPLTVLPSTRDLKTKAQRGLFKSQAASDNHHPWQRTYHYGQMTGTEDQRFYVLIPTTLILTLLALLVLVARRVIQRRKGLARRASRQATRVRVRETSQRPWPHRPRASRRPRPQNIYSPCPRRASQVDPAGQLEIPLQGLRASGAGAQPQVPIAPWFHAPSLKTSYDYVSIYHPAGEAEDADPDDYVNIPCPAHLSSCSPGLRL